MDGEIQENNYAHLMIGVYGFENPIMAIRQIFNSTQLLCFVILYISSIDNI